MSEFDSDFHDPRANALARLATLQRLREQAKAGNRQAMLESLEKLIEQESKVLREQKDHDRSPKAA